LISSEKLKDWRADIEARNAAFIDEAGNINRFGLRHPFLFDFNFSTDHAASRPR
jgi:hypothetical protein